MKRYSVLVWAGLVSACAVSTVAGCGDDDAETTPEPAPAEDAGRDASRTLPGRDAAGTDSQTKTDTGAKDTGTDADEPEKEAGTDAGADATPDADASADASADADAGTKPDADASPPDADAAPPVDAGDPTICHPGTLGTITSVFPPAATVAGLKVGYSECPNTVTVTANGGNDKDGRYSPNVKTGFDGRLTVTGLGFRRTISGWIKGDSFGPPANAALPLVAVGTGISPYENAKAHVLVFINGSGACLKSGNTVTIDGHGEATVTYVDSAGATVAGGKTGADGLAWISGINAGPDATITVTPGVAGCTRDNGILTGALPLIADSVTTISLTLKP